MTNILKLLHFIILLLSLLIFLTSCYVAEMPIVKPKTKEEILTEREAILAAEEAWCNRPLYYVKNLYIVSPNKTYRENNIYRLVSGHHEIWFELGSKKTI